MPIRKCSKDGKTGYKWGDGGNCIIRSTPEEAKKVVIRQGIKIEGPDKFKKIMEKEKGWTKEDKAIANKILSEDKSGGWYSNFAKDKVAEALKENEMDQFGNKKKKNPPIELPNDHSETSYTTMAKPVETIKDKYQNVEDLSDDTNVQTHDLNADQKPVLRKEMLADKNRSQQVFNLKDKHRQDEEDDINVRNPTT